MMKLELKHLDNPDQQRGFDHGSMQVVDFATASVVRGVLQPGWRWSVDVRPTVGGDSCQATHVSYVISGRFAVRMDDGAESEAGPGDALAVPPGHDAWVVGDQPCELIDFAAPAPTGQGVRCPCGVQFRIDGDDAGGPALEHLIAAARQHALGSHGHEVTAEHIRSELTPA
jgi:quercetin dioxygenase-like cupin family protein